MVILTLNCGSSSAKYQVYDWDNKDVLASGVVERVTQDGSVITHNAKGKDESTPTASVSIMLQYCELKIIKLFLNLLNSSPAVLSE